MEKRAVFARLAVAFAFALIAGFGSGLLYRKRDFLFEWDWAKAHGKLEKSVSPELLKAARDLAEEKNPGEACVARSVARDDRYLYLAIGCGHFRTAETMLPTRLRFSGGSVSSLEQPPKETYENSLRRLFPKAAWEEMRYGFPKAEVLEAGLARMKERGIE